MLSLEITRNVEPHLGYHALPSKYYLDDALSPFKNIGHWIYLVPDLSLTNVAWPPLELFSLN